MSYAAGSGTQIDPYIIATVDDWVYFWSGVGVGYSTANTYFKLQNDIDCGGATVTLSSTYFKCNLDGAYHTVKNQTFAGDNLFYKGNIVIGVLNNIHIDANFLSVGWSNGSTGGTLSAMTDVKWTIRSGKLFNNKLCLTGSDQAVANAKVNILLNQEGGSAFNSWSNYGVNANSSVYILSESGLGVTCSNATFLVGSDRFLTSSYPTLDWSRWVIVGATSPELTAVPAPPAPNAADVAKNLSALSFDWANSITKEQAWPGTLHYDQLEHNSLNLCPIVLPNHLLSPPLSSELGFIRGTVTRKGAIAAGKHVICLDARFNLIAETISTENGYYRFDNLLINGLYTIHAYDNETYQYAPVGADRRTPEAYP